MSESDIPLSLIAEVLGILERREARLLSWGLVDGGFSPSEIESLVEETLSTHPQRHLYYHFSAFDLLDEMEDRGLIHYIRCERRGEVVRSRMAETVRLLANLRQLFPASPQQISQNPGSPWSVNWRHAPTLVADFRFVLRPRSYPTREHDAQSVLTELTTSVGLEDLERQGLLGLLDAKDRGALQLSGFQKRATRAILSGLKQNRSKGHIVCAGTGSGKTLSFYLPALAHLTALQGNKAWTKALALYPRKELLKDQFLETYREARRLDAVLVKAGRPKIRIGAFFGATPQSIFSLRNYETWKHSSSGFCCPYMPCPRRNCRGKMWWSDSDVEAKIERLTCDCCKVKIDDSEIALTRESMRDSPPDIVFTTTEMLNRHMACSEYGHVFGLRTSRCPRVMLLDEVHTYNGATGAQTGLLIRRWRHAVGQNVQFVGLSATLRDAAHFFARLTGLSDDDVGMITPREDELVREGMEYLLALRSDPASRASLMSTTIQTAMLMARTMDNKASPVSDGLYGQKVFLFTDNLDVINRMYFNLLDAEGLDSWGRSLPLQQRPTGSLANLRSSSLEDASARREVGQLWGICEKLSHTLQPTRTLTVSRTSSQDVGVDDNSNIIVATASLEVGFNDPQVGVVIQHKAPHGTAPFLQRKGRAGRRLITRPWTVVVLSDYGRDRQAYQGYDLLFDPVLPVQHLPIQNRYILRMQAVHALMDWIAQELGEGPSNVFPKGSVWLDLAGPPEKHQGRNRRNGLRRQAAIQKLLEQTLHDPELKERLSRYLQDALALDQEEANVLLWDPPRSLLLAVFPTIVRRLRTRWTRADSTNSDRQTPYAPLPDFIPANLFSDLNLPEVCLKIPLSKRDESNVSEETMPIFQALREFTPGRVSKRFGSQHRFIYHWVPIDPTGDDTQLIDVKSWCEEFNEMGDLPLMIDGEQHNMRCLRPTRIHPHIVELEVRDTTNAFLAWQTRILPPSKGLVVDLPRSARWSELFDSLEFYTHSQQAPVLVQRIATGAEVSLRYAPKGGVGAESRIIYVAWSDVGSDPSRALVGVGFPLQVDGVCCRVKSVDREKLRAYASSDRGQPAFRAAWFEHLVATDTTLNQRLNRFETQWIFQVYMAMLSWHAIDNQCTLKEAKQALFSEDLAIPAQQVLQVIFQQLVVDQASADSSGESTEPQQKQSAHLLSLFESESVTGRLEALTPALWEPFGDQAIDWAVKRVNTTLGHALLDVCFQMCPDCDTNDLIVDFVSSPDATEIFITEKTMGGGGVIEQLLIRHAEDPRRILSLLDATLQPSDFEVIDRELMRFLQWIEDDEVLRDDVNAVRVAPTQESHHDGFSSLLETLMHRGLMVSHPVIAALGNRILRPGSSQHTDTLLRTLLDRWREEEVRLGVELDLRVVAFLFAQNDSLSQALEQVSTDDAVADKAWRFSALLSMLWPRGRALREQALSAYNPFAQALPADRELLLACCGGDPERVAITAPSWQANLESVLTHDGQAILEAPSNCQGELKEALQHLMHNPIEVGYLHTYPQVEAFYKEGETISVVLSITGGLPS